MDYSQASKRFDLDKFISKMIEMDYFDMVEALNREVRSAEDYHIPQRGESIRDIEYLKSDYISQLKQFGFLLNSGMKPAGADKRFVNTFAPVLHRFIEKKQLEKEILLLLEN